MAPSSRSLGRAMTGELVRKYKSPMRVLEVGGGTGSITDVIAERLQPKDTLDVFEVDPDFCNLLRRRFGLDRPMGHASPRIQIHNKPIEQISRDVQYDFIISGLPFTNFPPESVREIFEIYREVLKPGGTCSFFEYLFIRGAARLMRGAAERRRAAGVEQVVSEYLQRCCFRRDVVFFNMPPAKVLHISFHAA